MTVSLGFTADNPFSPTVTAAAIAEASAIWRPYGIVIEADDVRKYGRDARQRARLTIMRATHPIDRTSVENALAAVPFGADGNPYPRIEVYADALQVIAEAQKLGGICAFIDAEHALDVNYARKLGVKTEDLLVSQPDCGEQALEIADMLVRSSAIDMVVIDSVAALTPKAELEGDMGDSHMGLQARLMSQALRKLTGTISKSNTIVVFINQIRMKIGVMFGSPETTTGGNALKFYASVRMDIRRVGAIKDGETAVGSRTHARPAFLKSPTSSFFLVSMLRIGNPAALNTARCTAM